MNTKIIEVRVRSDGRRYPVTWKLPDDEWERVVRISHTLRCRDGLSYRQVQRALVSYGIRRSLGQVYADANRATCPHCPDRSTDPAAQERPAAHAHPGPVSGFLTSQLGGSDGP